MKIWEYKCSRNYVLILTDSKLYFDIVPFSIFIFSNTCSEIYLCKLELMLNV